MEMKYTCISQAWRFGSRLIVALNIRAFGMADMLQELLYYSGENLPLR
jgi:hypothetical protein